MGYRDVVLADRPSYYYRLGDSNGSTVMRDETRTGDGTHNAGTNPGQFALLPADASRSTAINSGSTHGSTSTGVGAIVASGTWSIEAWVRLTSIDGAGYAAILGCSVPGVANGFLMNFTSSLARLAYENTGSNSITGSASIVADRKVHHVVGTRSSSGVFLYVDGTQVATTATPGTAGACTGQAAIVGAYQATSSTGVWDGWISDLAIYSNQLSTAQVQLHYRGGVFGVRPSTRRHRITA